MEHANRVHLTTAFRFRSLFTYRSHSLNDDGHIPCFGVCYPETKPLDIISILYSYRYPLILRETRSPKTFIQIGEVYLHEYMNGEAVGHFPEERFEIH